MNQPHIAETIGATINRILKEGIGSTDTKPSKHTIESTTGAKSDNNKPVYDSMILTEQ